MINRITGNIMGGNHENRVDWVSIVIFVVLTFIGWLNIYAAVYVDGGEGFVWDSRYGSQMIWIGVSAVVAMVIMLIDEIYYHIIAYPFYWLMMLLFIVTLLFGAEVNGAKSWLKIGPMTVQPVEFGKVAMGLALARYMSSYHFSLSNIRNLLMVAGLLLLPMLIIVLQNDTGSAVVYGAFLMILYREGLNGWLYVAFGMVIYLFVFSFILSPVMLLASVIVICLIIEGVMNKRWRQKVRLAAAMTLFAMLTYIILDSICGLGIDFYWILLITAVLGAVAAVIYAYKRNIKNVLISVGIFVGSLLFIQTTDYVFDNVLQLHQQKRILNLLGIEQDTQNWGYNVNQSKIAIGSGGLFGKGFLSGTQTKYDFVPEQSTDFIFCTVGEEWGFVGSAAVLALFCLLIIRLMIMGERQKETFGRVYCYSVAAVFLCHVMINVGMTIGIMPVIGIPLPLFSYGGSSLLAFTILFFIAVKLDSRKNNTVSIRNEQ